MHLVFFINFSHLLYSITIFSSYIMLPHEWCCSGTVQCSTNFWNMTATKSSWYTQGLWEVFCLWSLTVVHWCILGSSETVEGRLQSQNQRIQLSLNSGFQDKWKKDLFRNPAWDLIISHKKAPTKIKQRTLTIFKDNAIIVTSTLSACFCKKNPIICCVFDLINSILFGKTQLKPLKH